MKIREVWFKNLNSLKGEFRISFDESPFVESGIFAITGPNGSGKTTILDAISLALYGETSRLKKPDETLINQRAADCAAAVTFTVDGGTYRSTWAMSRANGHAAQPSMRLLSLQDPEKPETVLADTVTRTKTHVSELTGLDFKRFSRSVMLPQGEFAGFLMALENERAEMLDKIVGNEIYDAYVADVTRRDQEAHQKLTELTEALALMERPNAESLREAKADIEQAEQSVKVRESELYRLRRDQERTERFERMKAVYTEDQISLAQALEHQGSLSSEAERLKRSQAGQSLLAELDLEDNLAAESAASAGKLAQARETVADLDRQLAELRDQERQHAETLRQVSTALTDQGGALDSAVALEREIQEKSIRFHALIARYETLEKAMNENLQTQARMRKNQGDVHDEIRKAEAWFQEHAADANVSADIETLSQAVDRLASFRKECSGVEKNYRIALKKEKKVWKKIDKSRKASEKIQGKLEKLKAYRAEHDAGLSEVLGGRQLEELNGILAERIRQLKELKPLRPIEKQYRRASYPSGQALTQKLSVTETALQTRRDALKKGRNILLSLEKAVLYAQDRHELRDGEPCPLCGALKHPFILQGSPADDGDLNRALKDQRAAMDVLTREEASLSAELDALQRDMIEVGRLQAQWDAQCQKAGIAIAAGDGHGFEVELQRLKREIREQENRIDKVRFHRRKLARLDGKIARIADRIAKTLIEQDELNGALAIHRGAAEAIQREIAEIQARRDASMAEIIRCIDTYGIEKPAAGYEKTLIAQLAHRKVIYDQKLQAMALLKERAPELRQLTVTLPEQLIRMKAEADALAPQLQVSQEALAELKSRMEAQFGKVNPIVEKQRLEADRQLAEKETAKIAEGIARMDQGLQDAMARLADQEAAHHELEGQIERLRSRLAMQLNEAGFKSGEEARESVLPASRCADIEKRLAEAEKALETLRVQAEASKVRYQEAAEQKPQDSKDVIARAIADATQRREEMLAGLSEKRERLEDLNCRKSQYEAAQRAASLQREEYDRAHAEMAVLAPDQQAGLRDRVRREAMARLLDQSNRQLDALSGRYIIRGGAGENGFSLEIEDRRYAEGRRPITGMSGGECFVVSLAMALGLADLARGGRRIETLFIDEGFGALDEESLYRVLYTLKNLKSDGKMVGIISHVRKLADEIPIQIRLFRTPEGESRMEVVA